MKQSPETPKVRSRVSSSTIFWTGLLADFAGAWFLMLLLGDLHHDVSRSVPLFSYWPCFWVIFLGTALIGAITQTYYFRQIQMVESLQQIERSLREFTNT